MAEDLIEDGDFGEASAFAVEVRAWLAANFPAALGGVDPLTFQNSARNAAASPDFQLWRERVADKGWGVPTWPARFGGAGLTPAQGRIIGKEMQRIGAFNPIRSFGTMMLGPTLLEYASEEQKARFLPPISRHDVRWCQGFSEPGAGSDLASLQMRCVDMSDHWLVNGQKIWTSGADEADWCFALVRTDTSRKQGGISFLLIDMASPGVEARPIVLISGSTHFCEVFFNDVKVPKDNLVGEVNQGWTIAKRLLQFERDSLSVSREIHGLVDQARLAIGIDDEGRIADPDLRGRLIGNGLRAEAFNQTVRRMAAEAKAGMGPNAGVSAMKNLWSDIAQDRAELLVEINGADGLGWTGDDYGEEARTATRAWLHSKCFSIYGGSQEVQSNIVAKRVLDLPDPR